MDQIEGIPLWEFIKPRAKNRVDEIASLLLFYADYQDQINQNKKAFDLFLTELLYAGYDCLISENLLNKETILSEFNIPLRSPLSHFTKLFKKFHSEPKSRLATMKQILKTFPIVLYTRMGRDLLFDRNWVIKKEKELKTDSQKFAIKPLSRKDFDGRDSDFPDIIKKRSKGFEEQFSKEYPHLSSNKIINDLVQKTIKESKKMAKQLNNLPKISQLAEDLTGLTRIKDMLKRKPGQEKGAIREGSNYDYKKGREEYETLLKIVKAVKKKVKEMEAKKDEAISKEKLFPFFKESLSEEELTLININQPPAKSAHNIWQLRNPHVADSFRSFQRRFPRKKIIKKVPKL